MDKIVLASASEGRKELFYQAFGNDIIISPMDILEEEHYSMPVKDMVCFLAQKKAQACALLYPEDYVFAFDTMVECQGKVLGKPSSKKEAEEMLKELSGKRQSVWTGYAFFYKNKTSYGVEEAQLILKLSPEEIKAYAAKHPVTKYAGAYALQKSDTKAQMIKGNFDVVVGACMNKVLSFVRETGNFNSF